MRVDREDDDKGGRIGKVDEIRKRGERGRKKENKGGREVGMRLRGGRRGREKD